MIKVKDPSRLKAFGFTELNDHFNGGSMYGKPMSKDGIHADYFIIVNGKRRLIVVPVSPFACNDEDFTTALPEVVLDDIFDLQAAGLLERVEEVADSNGQSD